jgi:galactose-1-phosphate uridylyltransferase
MGEFESQFEILRSDSSVPGTFSERTVVQNSFIDDIPSEHFSLEMAYYGSDVIMYAPDHLLSVRQFSVTGPSEHPGSCLTVPGKHVSHDFHPML